MDIFENIKSLSKARFALAVAVMGLVLVSCNAINLPAINTQTSVVDVEVNKYLPKEYEIVAKVFEDSGFDKKHTETLYEKATNSLTGKTVLPENPRDRRRLPDFSREELRQAHLWLLDSLMFMGSEENYALIARAQARFDCWVLFQIAFPTQHDDIACRNDFYNALSSLKMPAEDAHVYPLYFESASTNLQQDAYHLAQILSEKYADRPVWQVYLTGYTDRSGSTAANEQLAMRRAIAVRNMLAQHGFEIDQIIINAAGAAAPGESEDMARRVEVKVEPVYLFHKDRANRPADWSHTGLVN